MRNQTVLAIMKRPLRLALFSLLLALRCFSFPSYGTSSVIHPPSTTKLLFVTLHQKLVSGSHMFSLNADLLPDGLLPLLSGSCPCFAPATPASIGLGLTPLRLASPSSSNGLRSPVRLVRLLRSPRSSGPYGEGALGALLPPGRFPISVAAPS